MNTSTPDNHSMLNPAYKITRNEISYNPARDPHMEETFGNDTKFITKVNDNKCYSITLYLKSHNPHHYTEIGWVMLLESATTKSTVQWVLSHLSSIRVTGHNDHAKSAHFTFNVSIDSPTETQQLISTLKNLQSNPTITQQIGIGIDSEYRIHLLRSRSSPDHQYKYRVNGLSKTLANIDTKHIKNAISVTDILKLQLGFDPKHITWTRSISNKSRKFTTDVFISSNQPCPKLDDQCKIYTWHLVINGYQTTIPLSIENISRKNISSNTNELMTKMNDINVKEQYQNILDNNSITAKQRQQIIQNNIYNKHLLLKPRIDQVQKLCIECKWSEAEADKVILDRIQTLDDNVQLLNHGGGLIKIITDHMLPNNESKMVVNFSKLSKIRADANKYIFEGIGPTN